MNLDKLTSWWQRRELLTILPVLQGCCEIRVISKYTVLAIIIIMKVRVNVWRMFSMWEYILGILVLHFSGTQTGLSGEDCLLFGLLIISPVEMVVYGTNKTMRFLSKPLSPSGVKGRWHMQMVFVSAPLSDLGPFLPHLPPGPVQYNLIRWSFTEYCYMPGAVLTLEVQGEISCLAQETPSLPTHSHLTWYLHLSSYVKAPGESEGRSYSYEFSSLLWWPGTSPLPS